MRRILPLLLALLLLAPMGHAEESEHFLWTLRVGGEGETLASAFAVCGQGGVIVVGSTDADEGFFGEGLGGLDGFVLRVDADGNVVFGRRLGGSGDDRFTHVLETMDGNFILLGTSDSADGDTRAARGGLDAWIVCLDAKGETLWTKNLGGTDDDEMLCVSIGETGDIFLCGRSKSRNGDLRANNGGWDAWAAMISIADGSRIWVDRNGADGDDQYTQAIAAYDGWLVLGELSEAQTTAEEDEVVYHARPIVTLYTGEGDQRWSSPVMFGTSSYINRMNTMIETETGWLFIGETNSRSAFMPSTRGGLDIWVLSLLQGNASGSASTIAWQLSYGGGGDDLPSLIRPVPSGGYAVLGTTRSTDGQIKGGHGGQDIWLFTITATGTMVWQQTIGGSGESSPAGLAFTSDGGFYVAGNTDAQDRDIGRHASTRTGFLTRLSPNGNILWTRLIEDGAAESALTDLKTMDGSAYVLGTIYGGNEWEAGSSIFLGRLSEEGYYDQ